MSQVVEASAETNNDRMSVEEHEEKNEGKRTIGEELFLVHLSRHQERDPDDFDYEGGGPRQRSVSIGEELFQVHLARSKGVEPDLDEEGAKATASECAKTTARTPVKPKHKTKVKPKKPARCSERLGKVLHLRSRDVTKKMVM